MTIHKIEIKQKEGSEGRITTEANSIILLDGAPLKGVKSFNLEINAGEIAKVTLEMYVEVSGTADTYVLSLPAVKKPMGVKK